MPNTTQNKEELEQWEKDFDRKFYILKYEQDGEQHEGFRTNKVPNSKDIKHFISKLLSQAHQSGIEEERKSKQLELAEAQITGFYECYQGGTVESLIVSMGLTYDEWEKLCKTTSIMSWLPEELSNEFLESLKENKQ